MTNMKALWRGHADDLLSLWADAHVFYDLYDQPETLRSDEIEQGEKKWRKRIVEQTPNGNLIRRNAMFEFLKGPRVSLLHVTVEDRLRKLLNEGALHPSGGCLVGSIYCAILNRKGNEKDRYQVHNLGQYILEAEVPRRTKASRQNPIVPIIIEGELPQAARSNLVGVDYLRLGDIHLSIYRALEYLMFPDERQQLEEDVMRRIRASILFLGMCQADFRSPEKRDSRSFLNACVEAIQSLPVLGYFYFEALVEFILCHQTGGQSARYHEQAELYNANYKNLAYDLCPDLVESFNLANFSPTPDVLSGYIEARPDWGVDAAEMIDYVAERLAFLVCARLVPDAALVDWRKVEWRFERVTEILGPLVGHLIHRLLRKFNRSRLAYYFYDQSKAMQAWNYWNQNSIAVPFNGIIPKGEIGINPAFPLNWQFYRGRYENGYIEREMPINLVAEPTLVDQKNTFMRSK